MYPQNEGETYTGFKTKRKKAIPPQKIISISILTIIMLFLQFISFKHHKVVKIGEALRAVANLGR